MKFNSKVTYTSQKLPAEAGKKLFLYCVILILMFSCKQKQEYNIFYPKTMTTRETPKSLQKRFRLISHPDNPYKDGIEYYSYIDTVFGKMKTNLFVGFKNGALHLLNVRYFGSGTDSSNLLRFYDSCLLLNSFRDQNFKIYSRTNENFRESAQILNKSKNGVLGYYYFEINE